MDSFKTAKTELDLFQVARQLIKKWYIIVLAGVLVATIGYSYANFFITPTYRARSAMLIDLRNSKYEDMDYEQVTVAEKYVTTFAYVIKSSFVLQPVIDELGLKETPSTLASKLQVNSVDKTFVIRVSVDYPDKETALKIIKAIDKIAPEKIAEGITAGYITVIEEPSVSGSPVSPNKTRYAMLGGIGGAGFAVFVLIIIFMLNSKVKSVEELQRIVDLPVLGVIPSIQNVERNKQGGQQTYGE